MKTKTIKYILIVLIAFGVGGLATVQPSAAADQPGQAIRSIHPEAISVTIPNGAAIKADIYNRIAGTKPGVWGVIAYDGKVVQRQLIRVKNVSDNSFTVERRMDNGINGSGIVYKVDYNISHNPKDTIIKFTPVQSSTYQEGCLTPYAVPGFSEKDLADFIVGHVVGHKGDNQF